MIFSANAPSIHHVDSFLPQQPSALQLQRRLNRLSLRDIASERAFGPFLQTNKMSRYHF